MGSRASFIVPERAPVRIGSHKRGPKKTNSWHIAVSRTEGLSDMRAARACAAVCVFRAPLGLAGWMGASKSIGEPFFFVDP